ncbi:MAG: UDP-4-amino-4,6-dideoxy-N-acetyl-beta-L-altrosamine transaminase [Gammaproteobacteria bacterium RIFOXYA12_FULL_61_12]|nr:MAG: UDP-4-amino-4,6-dideoxy-N-acetyl-beta-L-altrosamine transaminase [Gammaproteobacteria bacterium RIFOXYD12_FULL_61_37]OGT94686.1 MAG: UDP-4-amino-4,6-dideoxy-N-acetyl-beta-L-altrosamine transaminase [Gammaproteobacteria bacterium RIFOXYA12_FULL_61_12]
MIPYGRQDITDDDIRAVEAVLRSDFLTQGPAVPGFEQAVAAHCGVAHAVATNSATSALHIACMALGLGPGDRLWTTPITFVASANCGLYCGAQVDFVDIDPLTYNLSVEHLVAKLESAEMSGTLPKVLVPVHMCGQPCDMEAIHALGQRYGFRIIEDASHAIGASFRGEPVGNCRYSDITVFSFHPVKIVTTGEGGVAVTNDASLAADMALLRSHGITRDAALMSQPPDGPWYYQQIALGFNYRITDIQAALGTSQMARLAGYVERREALVRQYDSRLAQFPLRRPQRADNRSSAWHLYVVRVAASDRLAVFNAMLNAGIGVNVHYTPVHLQPYYRRLGFAPGQFPHAEAHGAEAITLPLHPRLSAADLDAVVDALAEAVKAG